MSLTPASLWGFLKCVWNAHSALFLVPGRTNGAGKDICKYLAPRLINACPRQACGANVISCRCFPHHLFSLACRKKKCFLGVKNNINVQPWPCWTYFPPGSIALCHREDLHVRMERVKQWCYFGGCCLPPLFTRHLCVVPVISGWVTEVCL